MAMGPIDYLGSMPPQDLARNFQSGLQVGATIQALQQQQAAQQLSQQQAVQYQADVQAAMANPTPQAFSSLALKYPAQREAVKQSWDGLSAADQKAEGDTMAQAYSALLAGNTDAAKSVVQGQIEARKNSGLDTSHYDQALKLLDADPLKAQAALGFTLSHIGDPKDFAAKFSTLQKLPGEVADQDATVAGKQADNTIKGYQITAQKAAGLAKAPGLKPSQVTTFLQSEAAAGRLSPEELDALKQSMPTDPKALPDFLGSLAARGLTPEQNSKLTTPDANAQLQANTTRRGQDISASTAAARLAFDKDQANAVDGPDNTPEAEKKLWVHQYVAGNGSVPRSAPANVRSHIGTWAAEMGITPDDLSSGSAKAKFDQASAVTSGHRAGSMASVEATMPALTDNARQLAGELGQGRFVPVNKLLQMADENISDPKLAAFKVGHQAVVSEYQQVISRGGTNVTALREAMHALNSARGIDAYNAALKQVDKEVAINVAGTKAVRAGLGGNHGAASAPASAAPATALPAGWTVKVH